MQGVLCPILATKRNLIIRKALCDQQTRICPILKKIKDMTIFFSSSLLRLQEQMERHPQKWFVHDFPKMLAEAVDKISSFLGTRPEDTFLVQNVTKGIESA